MDEATRIAGFRWMPGMKITHVGQPMLVLRVEEDEWLGEPIYILTTYNSLLKAPICTVIAKDETYLDLSDPGTGGCLDLLLGRSTERTQHPNETLAESCVRTALNIGRWPGGAPASGERPPELAEIESLRLFRFKVTEMAKFMRAEHLAPKDFENRTFYPDHPLILLAGLVEAIEELSKENA